MEEIMAAHPERIQKLFVYFVNEKPGFWTFDGQKYHWFYEERRVFQYIRACPWLPACAFGECIDVAPGVARRLNRAAQSQGICLDWFDRMDDCELAEIQKKHPLYIFGLSMPAGHLPLINSIDR
jgi:hypothetical protein